MDWNPKTWKFNWKNGRDRWLILLAAGLLLLILAMPSGRRGVTTQEDLGLGGPDAAGVSGGTESETERGTEETLYGAGQENGNSADASSRALTYEQRLEERLESILAQVDGVGEAEVMIVLRSTEEKVWRVDKSTSFSSTRETDANGGSRQVQSQEISEETILTDQGEKEEPLLEKELYPEISGVIVSASGGGSPVVQAEISAAVEALFGIPAHKIKILKRVE